MLSYIIRRVLLMIPTLIGMTLLVFAIVRFAPGLTTGGGAMSENLKTDQRAAAEKIKKRLHLDQPFYQQYFLWMWDSVRGDFGDSIQYNVPVEQLIRERLPVTISMNLISTFVVYVIAIPGGLLASVKRGKTFDVTWSLGTLALFSLPIIWVGAMLLAFFANPQYLGWFPVAGAHSTNTEWFTSGQYASDYLWHMVLPVVCLSYGGFAYLSKIQRASMLDALSQDYVRTAKAKGLPARTIMLRHVFRNGLLPMITVAASVIPGLIGGAVVTERIFSIDGMGNMFVTAVGARDLPIIQAVAFISSVITLLSLLVADICYTVADPRVSYE
jgi:ABC-type dipeptide/oligopeptide/nickel transport system permease component